MRYRLKDKELQKTLDEISNGGFSRSLNETLRRLGHDNGHRFLIDFCETVTEYGLSQRYSARFWGYEIEEAAEYNPNGWNNYPEVTPPTGVLMRVETKGGGRFCAMYRNFGDDGAGWCYAGVNSMPDTWSHTVIRFRPWED